MTDKEFTQQVEVLVANVMPTLLAEAMHLWNCGAVDKQAYEPTDYVASKAILRQALARTAEYYDPPGSHAEAKRLQRILERY